jgi:Fic family protein
MAGYNWQQKDWPHFKYGAAKADDWLFAWAEKAGHFTGMLKALPAAKQMEAVIDVMTAEAIKTSEIEGEFLSRKDVMSSIKKT